MNYYSNQEIEQVIEEPDRLPRPASSHVALTSYRAGKPRDNKVLVKAGLFAGILFLIACVAQVVQLPSWVLLTVSALFIASFVYVSIKGDDNVRRH